MAAHEYITVEDVRNYMIDETPDDTGIDIAFSDDDIRQAMVRAAREYNSIPPRVADADPSKLSARTNMFLDAIAVQLYKSELQKLTRDDIDYSAGGVSTNIVSKRIDHLRSTLIPQHDQSFKSAAHTEKLEINISNSFGPVG